MKTREVKTRHPGGKTALVLAGGGLTGGVYEIGALRAVDDLLVDRTVNDFDIYVGPRAGSLIGSLLANGFSPDTILQVMSGSHPDIRSIRSQDILDLNYRELLRWSLTLPRSVAKAVSHTLRHLTDLSLFDAVWMLSEALPPGLYDSSALDRYVRYVFGLPGRSNNFADLARDLYIVATDLDSGERVVFGKEENSEVPISTAVAASCALPVVYRPVRIGDHEYVDGSVRGNASLDVAIEYGATLILCINPLVPYNAPNGHAEHGFLSEKGGQAVTGQASRIFSHSGLHYHIKQLRRSHPDVDIIVIEPRADDYQMFIPNIMRYSDRLTVAQHGFESVTVELAKDYTTYKTTLARHGIPLTRRLVIGELNEIKQSNYDPEVIRRVLESRSPGCNRRSDAPICQLDRTLAELELALDTLEPDEEQTSPELQPGWRPA